MINTIEQIIEHFMVTWEKLALDKIDDKSLVETPSEAFFVTIFHNWNIVWSSGTIKETESKMAEECIVNTVEAMKDSRFMALDSKDYKNIKIRVDKIKSRTQIKPKIAKIEDINPVTNWIIAIKSDYKKMAIILPNISTEINTWADFLKALAIKLNEDEFKRELYSVYSLETESITNF